jgi:hypothetical protein
MRTIEFLPSGNYISFFLASKLETFLPLREPPPPPGCRLSHFQELLLAVRLLLLLLQLITANCTCRQQCFIKEHPPNPMTPAAG